MGRSQERAVPIWEKDLEEMLAEAVGKRSSEGEEGMRRALR